MSEKPEEMSEKPERDLYEVIRSDGRYSPDAFAFLQVGLARAVREAYGEKAEAEEDEPHHVSGRQLCNALRDEARERWGMLARTVLKKWNIHETLDFGKMVYLLVENDLMKKTERDSVEDFRDVFGFDEAFGAEEIFELQE